MAAVEHGADGVSQHRNIGIVRQLGGEYRPQPLQTFNRGEGAGQRLVSPSDDQPDFLGNRSEIVRREVR